jgi:hypothetical protein
MVVDSVYENSLFRDYLIKDISKDFPMLYNQKGMTQKVTHSVEYDDCDRTKNKK